MIDGIVYTMYFGVMMYFALMSMSVTIHNKRYVSVSINLGYFLMLIVMFVSSFHINVLIERVKQLLE